MWAASYTVGPQIYHLTSFPETGINSFYQVWQEEQERKIEVGM